VIANSTLRRLLPSSAKASPCGKTFANATSLPEGGLVGLHLLPAKFTTSYPAFSETVSENHIFTCFALSTPYAKTLDAA